MAILPERRLGAVADNRTLLRLLQLASPSLPVGAYSYSEGLECAIESHAVVDPVSLRDWIADGLRFGGAGLEAAMLVRAYAAWEAGDLAAVQRWDAWLTAARESEEVRLQNLDMGRALLKLLAEIEPPPRCIAELLACPCNFAVAFAVAAAHWRITRDAAVLGYLQSWAANLVNAGVKLIPLGQTAGQRLLWELQTAIGEAARDAATVADEDLAVSNWGQALASMRHEAQYSRLFRS
jgi:urease accessory protein